MTNTVLKRDIFHNGAIGKFVVQIVSLPELQYSSWSPVYRSMKDQNLTMSLFQQSSENSFEMPLKF